MNEYRDTFFFFSSSGKELKPFIVIARLYSYIKRSFVDIRASVLKNKAVHCCYKVLSHYSGRKKNSDIKYP